MRVNTIKTTREEVLAKFEDYGWKCYPTQYAPNGIRFLTRPKENLFSKVEFKKGHFEI